MAGAVVYESKGWKVRRTAIVASVVGLLALTMRLLAMHRMKDTFDRWNRGRSSRGSLTAMV